MRSASLVFVSSLFVVAAPVAISGCDKGATENPDVAKKPAADRYEQRTDELIAVLAGGSRDRMMTMSGPDLHRDFSTEAFHDISESVRWLGAVKSKEMKKDEPIQGGRHRVYVVTFEKGTVELDVSIENDMVIGFHLSGDDWIAAEHGVIADKFREFKVYDFKYKTPDGEENPDAPTYHSKRVDWEIFVGGIEARQGEHHLTVEKICIDDQGNEVFHEPTVYDVRFDANAEGIPTGHVDGWIEVPKPGKYTLEIKLKDNFAFNEIDHIVEFEVDEIRAPEDAAKKPAK